MGSPSEKHRIFPALERMPDLSRGEQMFAAEVALATQRGVEPPVFAQVRAMRVMAVMAGYEGAA